MRCPKCSTDLIHPANFCPVCGTDLSQPSLTVVQELPVHVLPDLPPIQLLEADQHTAPPGPQTAPPPGTPPSLSAVEDTPEPDNVVPLQAVPDQQPPAQHQPPAEPLPGQPEEVRRNVLGELVDELFEHEVQQHRQAPQRGARPLGTVAAAVSLGLLSIGVAIYISAFQTGAGASLAGGFVLLAAVAWGWYLALPADQHHDLLLRPYSRLHDAIDRRAQPLRRHAGVQIVLRRERDRSDSMRAERSRRVAELGEVAYREFRAGRLAAPLSAAAQRVVAIEQQMLLQDRRIETIAAPTDLPPEKPSTDA